MTLAQAMKLGQAAKAKGLQVRAEAGRVQIVIVQFVKGGKSIVTPQSDWLSFDQAAAALGVA